MANEAVIIAIISAIVAFGVGIGLQRYYSQKTIELLLAQIRIAQTDIAKNQLPPGIWIPMTWIADLPQSVFNELMEWLPVEMQHRILGGGRAVEQSNGR